MHEFFRKLVIVSAFICIPAIMQESICNAQFYCQDTLLINEYFPCVGPYIPVCACNGVTYRNECFARQKDGIVGPVVNGVCGAFDFDIVPNPPVQNGNQLELSIFVTLANNVEIFIINVYGITVYRNTLRNVQNLQREIINTTDYEEGIHLVMVVVDNRVQSKRFSIVN